jgi:hypothetical protein
MSDTTCLDHDERKWPDEVGGYPYCVTCKRISAAVAEEREACARLVEGRVSPGWSLAADIRARGAK